jgi:polysaccharide biosynthesis/export protein
MLVNRLRCPLLLRRWAVAPLLALVALNCGGCASGRLQSASLPAQFVAPINENMEAIDLSRLSHYATNSELIERGDVLEITIVTNYSTLATTTTPVRVAEDGAADIPLIGPVAVAGLELESAEQAIAAAAIGRGVFQKPHITVTMKRQRSNRVTVIGAVKQPGVYTLTRGASSLLAALVSAGGLTEDAGPEVEIRQSRPIAMVGTAGPAVQPAQQLPGAAGPAAPAMSSPAVPGASLASAAAGPAAPTAPPILRVNLAKAAEEGDRQYPVGDGDVVIVSRRAPKPVYVLGLVHKPGEYRLPPNQNLQILDALALAGERTMQIADRVLVIRHVADRPEPVVIEVSVREAKRNDAANLRLAPGDVVSVEETTATLVVRTITDIVRFSFGGAVSLF